MRFTARQDVFTIKELNKELINTVVDTPVVLYKIHVEGTSVNIYGEGTQKTYYTGVQVPCLIDRKDANPNDELGTIDIDQENVLFAFLKSELELRNIYPEIGDIVNFDSQYYEINNTNEVQLYAGQVIYNHQVLCTSHLMRNVPTQLENPIV